MGRIRLKKKLLLISESMGGGLRKHVVQLIRNLDRNQFDIYFIHGTKHLDSAFREEYEELNNYAILVPCEFFIRELSLKNDLQTLFFLTKKIKEIQPDIVHCHSSKAGALGRIAAKICGIKKIFYTPHAYSFLAPEFSGKKEKIFVAVERYLSRYATTKTFCVSKGEMKEALKNEIDKKDKFEVIYNGLPDIKLPSKAEIRKQLGLPLDAVVIGNNARMTEQKNPQYFMEIAKEVITQDNNYHFVWAGDGPLMENVVKYVGANNLISNVHLLGDRSDSELIVAGYDVFLLTSLYEGLPYAPIEAIRAGVPILATNVTGNNEVVFNGKSGYFIVNEINIFNNLSRILKLNQAGLISDIFKDKFSLLEMMKKINFFYDADCKIKVDK